VYKPTAAYGHFGRTEKGFTWERTDRAAELADALLPGKKKAAKPAGTNGSAKPANGKAAKAPARRAKRTAGALA
jgi:S-adenosylmethionine synthetase